MDMMEKYSSTPIKAGKVKEENLAKAKRITVGSVFIQPTGGKGGKELNYSFCYFGMTAKNEEEQDAFVAGFSMSNRAMLESVKAGLLSNDFAEAFNKFAETYAPEGHIVLK